MTAVAPTAVALPAELNAEQQANARLIYREGRRAGLSLNRARELVLAAWHESRLLADAKGPAVFGSAARSAGVPDGTQAAGLFQLFSAGYRSLAERLGGLFDPLANTKAILPDYVAYWQRRPAARMGEAARDVERSGKGAAWYARDSHLFAWLDDVTAKATSLAKGIAGFVFPVPGGTFKNDWHAPRDGGARQHKGIDVFAPTGTPVEAPFAGVVSLRSGGAGGNAVWIDGKWYLTHLDTITVEAGQRVAAGQQIGTVGHSGNASPDAPHVHFGYDPTGGFGALASNWANPFALLSAALTGGSSSNGSSATGQPVGLSLPEVLLGPLWLLRDVLGVDRVKDWIANVTGVNELLDSVKRKAQYAGLWLLFALLAAALILLGVLRLLGFRAGTVVNAGQGGS